MKIFMALARLAAVSLAASGGLSVAIAQDAPLTLEQALRLADEQSLSAAIAETDIEIAEGIEKQAGLGPNPELSVDLENVAGSGAFQGLKSTETTVALNQRIELGGKRGARRRTAAAQTGIARLQSEAQAADLKLIVRQRFTAALAAKERLEYRVRVVERTGELVRIANALVDAGREPPLRAMRARASHEEAKAAEAQARAEDLSARLLLAETWNSSEAPPSLAKNWISSTGPVDELMLDDSISMQLANAKMNASRLELKRAKADAVPDITLGAGVRHFGETNDNAFTLGASISIPFGNRNQGNIAAAENGMKRAGFVQSRSRLELIRRYRVTATQFEAARARVRNFEQVIVPEARQALRLVRMGYRYGKFSMVELLDAAASLDEAEHGLIDARTAVADTAAVLIRLTSQGDKR